MVFQDKERRQSTILSIHSILLDLGFHYFHCVSTLRVLNSDGYTLIINCHFRDTVF